MQSEKPTTQITMSTKTFLESLCLTVSAKIEFSDFQRKMSLEFFEKRYSLND